MSRPERSLFGPANPYMLSFPVSRPKVSFLSSIRHVVLLLWPKTNQTLMVVYGDLLLLVGNEYNITGLENTSASVKFRV